MSEIRINKVVKELNIGITTLTEFLKKKGFDVEASPNSKISEEAYELARKEFVKEITIKAEAQKKGEAKLHQHETVSIDNVKEKKEQDDEEKEVLIKTTQVEPPRVKIVDKVELEPKDKKVTKKEESPETVIVPEKEKEIKKEKTTPKEEKPIEKTSPENNIKVKGKINLDDINSKTRPDKKSKKEKEKEQKPAKEEKREEKKPSDYCKERRTKRRTIGNSGNRKTGD